MKDFECVLLIRSMKQDLNSSMHRDEKSGAMFDVMFAVRVRG